MTGVAWRTCVSACLVAVFAVGSARVYDRCELAQDLRRLGIHPNDVSTWVCIAYHESRFDTSAYNPYSGDHGLLQISHLYWCGPGKACGLPCSALRDEDIADDVQCALQIHEEHTRLQGDGFLAWVVYLQHCKHNTKKYLADCDSTPKNITKTHIEQPTFTFTNYRTNSNYNYSYKIQDLVPPYFHSGFREQYKKELVYKNEMNKIDTVSLQSRTTESVKSSTMLETTTSSSASILSSTISTASNEEKSDREKLRSPFQFRLLAKPSTVLPSDKDAHITTTTYTPRSAPPKASTTNAPPASTTAQTIQASLSTASPIGATSFTRPHVKDYSSFTTERLMQPPAQNSKSTYSPAYTISLSTPKPLVTTTTKAFSRSAVTKSELLSSKPTQSIFDLYLKPTKRPALPPFPKLDSPLRLRIFYDGTTARPGHFGNRL